MPSFLLYFGDINASGPYLPSLWTSLWTAMSSLMQAIGAIIAGSISVRLGRKWPACAGACLTLVGTALQYIAVARGTLLAGKMVSGLGIGCVYSIATTYAGEVSKTIWMHSGMLPFADWQTDCTTETTRSYPDLLGRFHHSDPGRCSGCDSSFCAHHRPVSIPLRLCTSMGRGRPCSGFVGMCTGVSWEELSHSGILEAHLSTHRSPVYLVTRGKTEAARNAMRRIYGNSDHTDDRLSCLIHDIKLEEASQQDKGTYAACFRGSHLRRTMTIALLFSLTNVSGAAFLSQNIYFLITAGLEAIHAFDIGIGGFGLALLIIAVNSAYMHRCNRRSLILVGLTINFVFMITIGALYWAPGEGALWAIAVLMNVLISLTTSTLQAAAWPVAAEIPSYHLRAKSISLGVFTQTITSWLFIFVTPYMYNVDTGDLGARTGFIYAGTTLLLGICAFRLVPDTTGLTTTEVDAAYAAGVSPRRFQEFTSEAARDEDSKA